LPGAYKATVIVFVRCTDDDTRQKGEQEMAETKRTKRLIFHVNETAQELQPDTPEWVLGIKAPAVTIRLSPEEAEQLGEMLRGIGEFRGLNLAYIALYSVQSRRGELSWGVKGVPLQPLKQETADEEAR
jgi:hypothetical protein